MSAMLILWLQAQMAVNVAPRPDARDLLSTVEASRNAIVTGVLELRYYDAIDDVRRYTSDMTGFFDGHDRYGISLRNHTFFDDGINDTRDPQCVQVFNGAEMLGMWRAVAVQEYFVVEERAARLQCFNPLWLGLAYFPLPGSNPDDLYFWRADATVEYLGPDPAQADWHRVQIRKLAPADLRSETVLTIDAGRGWNVVRVRADLDNGYTIQVETDLTLFGDIWFPSRVVMRQQGGGGSAEAIVEVLNADLNVPLPNSLFDWPQLGAPDGGVAVVVKDLRPNAEHLILGYFDGQAVFKERPRYSGPPRELEVPRTATVERRQVDIATAAPAVLGRDLLIGGIGVTLFVVLGLYRRALNRCRA